MRGTTSLITLNPSPRISAQSLSRSNPRNTCIPHLFRSLYLLFWFRTPPPNRACQYSIDVLLICFITSIRHKFCMPDCSRVSRVSPHHFWFRIGSRVCVLHILHLFWGSWVACDLCDIICYNFGALPQLSQYISHIHSNLWSLKLYKLVLFLWGLRGAARSLWVGGFCRWKWKLMFHFIE